MVCVLDLAFVIGIGLFVQLALADTIPPDRRSDPLLGAIRVVGLLGAAGTIVALAAAARSWSRGGPWMARLKYTSVAVASVGFAWFAIHWRLLAANFGY